MARFVLVHGAFSGAWFWELLIGELESGGHTVEAFDLPGSGADASPVAEATLDRYAQSVCETLGRGEPAILVGHSMGGVVITQAAANCSQSVALLVFVAAFMPADGQSLIDLTALPEGKGDGVQANITVDGDPPSATLSDEAWRTVLARARTPTAGRSVRDTGIDPGRCAGRHPPRVRALLPRPRLHGGAPAADDARAPVRRRRRDRDRPFAAVLSDEGARRSARALRR